MTYQMLLRLSVTEHEALIDLARQTAMSQSAVIRHALRLYQLIEHEMREDPGSVTAVIRTDGTRREILL